MTGDLFIRTGMIKWKKNSFANDFISRLPDDVLQHIISSERRCENMFPLNQMEGPLENRTPNHRER